jgi:hypothetical protein
MAKSDLFSVNALSKQFGHDRRTIDKLVAHIEPAKVEGKTKFYRLADVEAALKSKGEAAPLREQKLREEIRKLQIDNDTKEKKLIERSSVCSKFERIAGWIGPMLEQKLTREYPQAVAPTPADIPRCKIIGQNLCDSIMREIQSYAEEWK